MLNRGTKGLYLQDVWEIKGLEADVPVLSFQVQGY